MLESVSGESGVIDLDVDFEILVETMCLEEAYHGFSVHIVLMFGGFQGFGSIRNVPVNPFARA